MPTIPLFTRAELTAAFALIYRDPATAEHVATEWFVRFVGEDLDDEGRFMYQDWREIAGGPLGEEPDAVVVGEPHEETSEAAKPDVAFFGGWSDEQKTEFVLQFSDFHLGLVALVSPALFERMRAARGLTLAQAERSRAQIASIAGALRG